jgi:hypothetical protein
LLADEDAFDRSAVGRVMPRETILIPGEIVAQGYPDARLR